LVSSGSHNSKTPEPTNVKLDMAGDISVIYMGP